MDRTFSVISIDGSFGECWVQILRSALAMVAGNGFRIERIRAGRKKRGLMRQHLTAVLAAGRICDASVERTAVGSKAVTFRRGLCFARKMASGLWRKAAMRTLDQAAVNASFEEQDILTNCRNYPLDESPAAYKDFDEVLRSVKLAGLASEVARLKARFVIKDASEADD